MGTRAVPRLSGVRRGIVGVAVLAGAFAALAPAAHAATGIVTRDDTTLKVDFGAGEPADGVSLLVKFEAGQFVLDENGGPSTMAAAAAGCALVSTVVKCDVMGATLLRIELGGGADFTDIQTLPPGVSTQIFGEGGDDPQLRGSTADDEIHGGPGDDELDGFAGDDVLIGGDGDDTLSGQGETDDLSGGDGFDLVDFTGAEPEITVSLNDLADDGRPGEHDNVRSDIEDIEATSGRDIIVGSAKANVIRGLGGDDDITGGGGSDLIDGDQGDDTITDRDGAADRVDCGYGTDVFTGDEIDAAEGCETQSRSPELQTDVDGDGAARPVDCNDADPAIRPGAVDVPDDGVDQDCDGLDATNPDRDGDGVPRPADCDDGDARAAPGLPERRGNRRDEDCNGRAEPFLVVDNGVPNAWGTSGAVTRNLRLGVRDVRKGMRVQLRCRGGGCPFARRDRAVKRRARLLDLHPLIARARLRAGARLELRILRRESIGKVVRYSFRASAAPRSQVLCLPPGKKRPRAC